MPILAGSYKCKGHRTRYTYEATWDEHDRTARWTAKIFDDGRLATTSGELRFTEDAGAAVQKKVHAYIEAVSCAAARKGLCSGQRRDAA